MYKEKSGATFQTKKRNFWYGKANGERGAFEK